MQTKHAHKILKIASADAALCRKFSRELGVSAPLAQILINRGLNTVEQAAQFLNVSKSGLLDPYDFKDMRKATELIRKAAARKDKVMVFGDYDADGITALALLKSTLKEIGIDCLHYLPHRIKEGYGLNRNIASLARQTKSKLLITVDCGTSDCREIEELRRNNCEVIVTDHHEPQEPYVPAASCILNPKLKHSGYAYRDLAGVGVAYKLCQALSRSMLFDDLDLVSLGTIADCAPLTGENRIIAKEGLLRLSRTKREGLKALIRNAGIKGRKFTSTFVSFILAPRINASGRMDTAEISLNLLLCETREEAEELARVIETHNRARQKVEGRILEEAQDLINREINFKEHRVIVIAKENWHQGVLGIVASKLADRFYRPAVVISLDDRICKGSGRSIKNFHLFDALLECRQFLDKFGGHAHAAGLHISRDSIEDFKYNINRLAGEWLSLEDLIPSLDIDAELGLDDISESFVRELQSLEPFGEANPEPLLYTRNLKVRGEPQVLSRDTLKFRVSDGRLSREAIGFGMSDLRTGLINAQSLDLVYCPKIDDWGSETGIILEVRDVFFR